MIRLTSEESTQLFEEVYALYPMTDAHELYKAYRKWLMKYLKYFKQHRGDFETWGGGFFGNLHSDLEKCRGDLHYYSDRMHYARAMRLYLSLRKTVGLRTIWDWYNE